MENQMAQRTAKRIANTKGLEEALRLLLAGLTVTQVSKLQEVLTPSQMDAFLEVWRLLYSKGNGKSNGANRHHQSS